jgi:hypothetical protein
MSVQKSERKKNSVAYIYVLWIYGKKKEPWNILTLYILNMNVQLGVKNGFLVKTDQILYGIWHVAKVHTCTCFWFVHCYIALHYFAKCAKWWIIICRFNLCCQHKEQGSPWLWIMHKWPARCFLKSCWAGPLWRIIMTEW